MKMVDFINDLTVVAALPTARLLLSTVTCVCLLLQDLVQSCLRGGGDIGRVTLTSHTD